MGMSPRLCGAKSVPDFIRVSGGVRRHGKRLAFVRRPNFPKKCWKASSETVGVLSCAALTRDGTKLPLDARLPWLRLSSCFQRRPLSSTLAVQGLGSSRSSYSSYAIGSDTSAAWRLGLLKVPTYPHKTTQPTSQRCSQRLYPKPSGRKG